jgi:hypothetical protein
MSFRFLVDISDCSHKISWLKYLFIWDLPHLLQFLRYWSVHFRIHDEEQNYESYNYLVFGP